MLTKVCCVVTLVGLLVIFVSCAEKPDLPNTFNGQDDPGVEFSNTGQVNNIIVPNVPENQTVAPDIPVPQNIQCNLIILNDNILQAEAIWDNNLNRYNERDVTGYQYVWNIYGEEIHGYIDREDGETFTGTSIAFNREDSDNPISMLARGDYGDLVSEYSEIACELFTDGG